MSLSLQVQTSAERLRATHLGRVQLQQAPANQAAHKQRLHVHLDLRGVQVAPDRDFKHHAAPVRAVRQRVLLRALVLLLASEWDNARRRQKTNMQDVERRFVQRACGGSPASGASASKSVRITVGARVVVPPSSDRSFFAWARFASSLASRSAADSRCSRRRAAGPHPSSAAAGSASAPALAAAAA